MFSVYTIDWSIKPTRDQSIEGYFVPLMVDQSTELVLVWEGVEAKVLVYMSNLKLLGSRKLP